MTIFALRFRARVQGESWQHHGFFFNTEIGRSVRKIPLHTNDTFVMIEGNKIHF